VFSDGVKNMANKEFKKFSETKQKNEIADVVVAGQMTLNDYMYQMFGCDAVQANELPPDEPSLSLVFDYREEV